VRFESSDYESLSRLKHAKDPGYHDSRTIVSKLKKGYEHRYEQAQLVKQKIEESPYPAIITGDFNDVPNSNTYFTIRGKLQDAFLEKGSFIGRTFRYISPTLRIDYIFADKSFKVNQFRVIHVRYSDHYPLETDLQW
jgi:endonuclease/exonuclease/phosphatase family metal-dependent hydrolase